MRKPLGARLEQYPGDFALQLVALERGRAEGTVGEERILAFLAEVRQVANRTDSAPWRARALQAVVGAILCSGWWDAVAIGFPDLAERLGRGMDLALGLGCLALIYAAWSQLIYFRRTKAALAWFEGLEATIRRGGKIVDYLRAETGGDDPWANLA